MRLFLLYRKSFSDNFLQQKYKSVSRNYNSLRSQSMTEEKSAGRWTKQEHLKFMEGLRIHGKNWKKIELHISSRSGAQVRSHAQKFFGKSQQKKTKKNTDAHEEKHSDSNDLQHSPGETMWEPESEHSYFVQQLYASYLAFKNSDQLVFSLLDCNKAPSKVPNNDSKIGFRPYRAENNPMRSCLTEIKSQNSYGIGL